MTPACAMALPKENIYSVKSHQRFAVALGLVLALAAIAQPATAQDIFASGTAKGQQAKVGIIQWVQIAGVLSILVCALIWIGTGRANWRWLAGAVGGLFIAGLADPIVSFFLT